MQEMDKSGHDPITYERVRDWFGADGSERLTTVNQSEGILNSL